MTKDDFITVPAVYGDPEDEGTAEDLIANGKAKYTNYCIRKDSILLYAEASVKNCCEIGLSDGRGMFTLISVKELEKLLFEPKESKEDE